MMKWMHAFRFHLLILFPPWTTTDITYRSHMNEHKVALLSEVKYNTFYIMVFL
jgi:hypothetical protein